MTAPARRHILEAHESVRMATNARTRRLMLRHAQRAMELLNEALGALPEVRNQIPEAVAYPTATGGTP